MIFSDKHCEFPKHPDIKVAWPRWYRRAIDKSARQLIGAEGWLKKFPSRVFLDRSCSQNLPIPLPATDVAKYHLIAVTRGSYDAAKKYFGGGSSGSLMLNTSIVGACHSNHPFQVGFPLSQGQFVHVLDEMTLHVLLTELDTLPDFVEYLERKEQHLSTPGVIFNFPGEEQLLARYVINMSEGGYGFDPVPAGFDSMTYPEGDWEYYSVSPQRKARSQANAESYEWDRLIEYQSSFIKAGVAVTHPDAPTTLSDGHERVVRALAEENRFSRRKLARHLRYALSQNIPERKFARVVQSSPDRVYVFLSVPKPPADTYEEYRELRTQYLLGYCHGCKLKFPSVKEAIGVASEPYGENQSSQDFLYVELGEHELADEERRNVEILIEEMDILQPERMTPQTHRENDFPVSFGLGSDNGPAPNRAQRRALARQQKRHKKTAIRTKR